MIDAIDLEILKTLQTDARKSITKLGEKIGLSTTQCWRRVKELEQAWFIERYVAILNQKALGRPFAVLVEVSLNRHDSATLEKVGAAITKLPEVSDAYLTPRDHVFLLKAHVSGAAGYERFLRKGIYKIPGIRRARASFVLRTVKQSYCVNMTEDREAHNPYGGVIRVPRLLK